MLPVPTPDRRQLWTRLGSRLDAHLHGQFPLPLVGGLQGRWPALSREWGGGAGRAAGLGVLAGGGGQHLGPGPLGGLQLLPEQQVVPGLLHLPRKARGASPLHPRQPTEHHGLAQTWRAQLSRLRLWMASAPTPALQPPPLSSASPPSPSTCRRSRQTHVSGHPLLGGGHVPSVPWVLEKALRVRQASTSHLPCARAWQAVPAAQAHLLQEAQLLQLPLVVQDEAVTPGPPACQVLLTTDIGHRRIQDSPSPPLHA